MQNFTDSVHFKRQKSFFSDHLDTLETQSMIKKSRKSPKKIPDIFLPLAQVGGGHVTTRISGLG
jgi:hypothetical protein